MLKIDIINQEMLDGVISRKGQIVVNSTEDPDSYYSEYNDGENYVSLYNKDVINELLMHSLKEVGAFFSRISYYLELDDWEFGVQMNIICKKYLLEVPQSIKVEFRVESEKWKKPYSLLEFSKMLSKTVEVENDASCSYFQDDEEEYFIGNPFGITFLLNDKNAPIRDEEERVLKKVKSILSMTKATLLATIDKDIITTFFSFPDEIKTACNQYLVYFAQFLSDAGIEVQTEIKEEAHKTLFKIIPKNKEESLDKIREALNIYLCAPELHDFNLHSSTNTDVAVMQWQANIMHLKSQLMLANSVVQLKDATIQSLQLSNYQYQKLLEKDKNQASGNEEEIIKGIVSVKKYEGKGFSVNLAEILRRLKRTFK